MPKRIAIVGRVTISKNRCQALKCSLFSSITSCPVVGTESIAIPPVNSPPVKPNANNEAKILLRAFCVESSLR